MKKEIVSAKSTLPKRTKKADREHKVLIGLVELYLKTGKPIGSHTLREHGFHDLSSATIRNYFSQLEEAGYLAQQHTSGGRIPTDAAYKLYASEYLSSGTIEKEEELQLHKLREAETRELGTYLNMAIQLLSGVAGYASFLSSPRFDHDFILDIKLVSIDHNRCLCVLITNFGLIQTEVLYTDKKISAFSLKRMENYFSWRLKGEGKVPPPLTDEEEKIAKHFYHEIMIRYIVNYSHFSHEDLYRTGFSNLLAFPEFNDPLALANGLSLFENPQKLSSLLKDSAAQEGISFWIGEDLTSYAPSASHCAVIAVPYRINQVTVGAVGLLGPTRLPYRHLFGILQVFSSYISESLTQSLYKFKLQYRHAKPGDTYLDKEDRLLIHQSHPYLLENKS